MSSSSPTEPASTPVPKRRIVRTLLVRSSFVGAVILTLLVAFYMVERIRGRAAWNQYQEEARARGVRLSLTEFVPPLVSDERNFAAVPVFQQAFVRPPPPNPFELPKNPDGSLPNLGIMLKGQLPDLSAWQEYFVKTKRLPVASDNAANDVLKALEHYAPQFEQLRAAAERPESRFPVRYEDGIAAALPHVGLLQGAAKLNALRLTAHLALGDSPAAYEDFRLGMRLYTALETEPTLISGLVRLSVLAILENATWAGLVRHQWKASELEKMIGEFGKRKLLDDYHLSFGSERGFNNLIYDQLFRNGTGELGDLLLIISSNDRPVFNKQVAGAILAMYPRGWLRLSQTRANRYFDEALTRVSQDPPRIHAESPLTSFPANMANVGIIERTRYLLFLTMVPAIDNVVRQYAYGQTLLDEARLGCALELHRLAHGSFPASLDLLVPAVLPELPRDVLTGEPFHYRLDAEGGYVLYAVAWNRVDDGGKIDPKLAAKEQPDWVWTIPGTK